MVSEANRLAIGPGIFRKDGWKVLDACDRAQVDYRALIPPLPDDVKAVEWDEIEWIHGITSLRKKEAQAVVPELLAALKPGGKLILEQTDFNRAKENIDWVFGETGEQNDPLMMNYYAYTPETLAALLRESGFSRIEILPAKHHVPARDFRVEAYR